MNQDVERTNHPTNNDAVNSYSVDISKVYDSKGNEVDLNELQDLVASNDTGGRNPEGWVKQLMIWTAIIWSVFQLYYASPYPYALQQFLHSHGLDFKVVIDDTAARSIHLAFAFFLAFLSYPATAAADKNSIPKYDWTFALVGGFVALYGIILYQQISTRIGMPTNLDIIVGVIGILLLLEACRRSLGFPLVVISISFLLYNYFGQFLPIDWVIAHKSGSFSQIINQQWITTEGVFGVALSVSTKYVFPFVLFGALLEKAGAGNYFIKTAFAYLGHLRGGPAKAAVAASGLTGLISGSSIANVVTTGTFTIPMMKRVGFTREKSGAVEVASSVNGQIMPPVMGAAAFLMVEYVGMPYSQLIKHAFLPAIISYIALMYIVHLEACKANLEGLPRVEEPRPLRDSLISASFTITSLCILSFVVYYGLGWVRTTLPNQATFIVCVLLLAMYVALISRVAKYPDLTLDDPNEELLELPKKEPTVNAGLHFLLPVVILIWFLMVEQKSPGLSAFWGTMALIFIQLTQRSLLAFFRKQGNYVAGFKAGILELKDGLEAGARNMIGIGIATATAGIIVGVVALTGFGAQLSNIIELLSGGNLIVMLVLVAFFSLILGMGLPTTANYIVVSSLMAIVIVEVGQSNGLVIPLIAVHLFVFYFGIMADVTPPVGLASFAASAISGGDPIHTGLTAFKYSLRTGLLPFLFIFNTDLLLIDVGFFKGVLVFVAATIAMIAFTAATMNFFLRKNHWYETLLLLLVTAMLFRPGFFMDCLSPSKISIDAAHFVASYEKVPKNQKVLVKVSGLDATGKPTTFYTELPTVAAQNRIEAIGLTLRTDNEKIIVDDVVPESIAAKAGFDWDQEILELIIPAKGALPKELVFIPALLVFLWVAQSQRRRGEKRV